MVNWHLLKDMRPPQTQEEWEAEFEKYKQFPEYEYVHKEMTLEQYRTIYYMEYIHRMWGRAIGLVFAIPATYFFVRGSLSHPLKIRTLIYAGLIGFQVCIIIILCMLFCVLNHVGFYWVVDGEEWA